MRKCYQLYKLVSLGLDGIITLISVCMNKKLLQNQVVHMMSAFNKPSQD